MSNHVESLDHFRVEYHKYWQCQLSSLNKKEGSKRNKSCPVTLDILIKKVNPNTIKNDKEFLGRETPLPAVITIKGSHNHPTNQSFESLGFLRISSETKEQFFQYFDDGNSPAEAMRLHESKILVQEDGPIKLADASQNPSSRTVYHLHDLWKKTEYGEAWASDPLSKLKEKIETYAQEGTLLRKFFYFLDQFSGLLT